MINIMSKLISTAASLSKAEYPDKRHQIAVIMDSDLYTNNFTESNMHYTL